MRPMAPIWVNFPPSTGAIACAMGLPLGIVMSYMRLAWAHTVAPVAVIGSEMSPS